jgi:hypothetical protein
MASTANYFVIIDRCDRTPVACWVPATLREAAPSDDSTRNAVERAQVLS